MIAQGSSFPEIDYPDPGLIRQTAKTEMVQNQATRQGGVVIVDAREVSPPDPDEQPVMRVKLVRNSVDTMDRAAASIVIEDVGQT